MPDPSTTPKKQVKASTDKAGVLEQLREQSIQFLRLQFTDILGIVKNVEVPAGQFAKAIEGEVTFDGSSIEGFTRIEESDMLLKPDLSTFLVFPQFSKEDTARGKVARLICDVHLPDGEPFVGDPRYVLKQQLERALTLGFEMRTGPEPEFFLFERSQAGDPTVITHDRAGYFDLAPIDKGERLRREIVNTLLGMGFNIEAAHHEVAPGQHEIDFKYAGALETADNLSTFKFVVKRVALENGLHASFLPKPIQGVSGSGMHCHLSLFKDGVNAFFDEKGEYQLSQTALFFIGGLLEHAASFTALTNPLVNSYKRLVPGFEAPVNIAWSTSNRSALIRVPAKRGGSTRAELRMPDSSCNPYLAFTAMLAAGLNGIENQLEPPPAIERNIFKMTVREKRKHRIRELPGDLGLALDELEKSELMHATLGEHLFEKFLEAKRAEWLEYSAVVHPWELERYLANI